MLLLANKQRFSIEFFRDELAMAFVLGFEKPS
jgi:hypothetical protein